MSVVATMTGNLVGALTEHGGGWTDPMMLRRGMALVAFAIRALSGALLILNLGVAAALSFGLGIIIAVAIAAHLVSRSSSSWSELRPAAGS